MPSSDITYSTIVADLCHLLLADTEASYLLEIRSHFVLDENSCPLQKDFHLLNFHPDLWSVDLCCNWVTEIIGIHRWQTEEKWISSRKEIFLKIQERILVLTYTLTQRTGMEYLLIVYTAAVILINCYKVFFYTYSFLNKLLRGICFPFLSRKIH